VNEAKAAKGAYKAEGAKGVNEAKAAKADGGTNGSKGMEGTDRTEGVDVAGAVLQVAADDTAGLAEALKSLYKNEGIRNELIEKGASRVADLSIRGSAAVIGELLENVRRAG
ncbi:MAG TPA: hypothetical protein VHC96_07205, partial [Puia sp.]|nr:hypothetical protein [Puia sp.]